MEKRSEYFGWRPSVIKIAPFELKYLESAMEVAEQIHATSIYANMPLNREKLVAQLSMAGNTAPDRFFRLAVRDDVVLGAIFGMLSRTFFDDELIAKDLGWWVRPEARGGRTALVLLQAFEAWARERGARKIGLGQTGVHDIERTRRLFEHAGYQIVGYNAMKDL